MQLSAEPKEARPILAALTGSKEGPTSITLPVLPAYHGRVLDPEGRPAAGVQVGQSISFADGAQEK